MTQPQIGSAEVSPNEHINRDAEVRLQLKVFFAVLSQTCARVADFKVLCVQPKKQTSIRTCLLPTWQVGIELQLLSDGKSDVIFVHRQTDTQKKGVLRHPPYRFLGARGLVSIQSRFFHSLLFLSHTFLHNFPFFHFIPTFITFSTIYLFIYLFVYCEKELLTSSRLSVRSSAWNETAPTGRIFMKFNMSIFRKICW